MAYATDIRAYGATLSQRISETRAALADRYAKYSTYRRTLDELASLTDRGFCKLDRGNLSGRGHSQWADNHRLL